MLKKLINLSLVLSMVVSLVCVGTPTVSADEEVFADPTTATGVYKTLYSQNFDSLTSLDGAGFGYSAIQTKTVNEVSTKSDEWALKSENETANKYLNWKRNFATAKDATTNPDGVGDVTVSSAAFNTSKAGKIVMSAKIKVNLAENTSSMFEIATIGTHWSYRKHFQVTNIKKDSFELYVSLKQARITVKENITDNFCRFDFVQNLDTDMGEIYVNGKSVMSEIPFTANSNVNTMTLTMRSGSNSADIDIDDLFVGKELTPDPQTTGEYKQIFKQDFNSLNAIEDAAFTLTNVATDSGTTDKDILSLKTDSIDNTNKYINLNRKSALSTTATISKEFDTQSPPNTIVLSAKIRVNSGTGNIELATGGTAYTHMNKFQIADIKDDSFTLKHNANNSSVTVNEDIKNSFVRFDYIQNLDTLKGEIYVNGDLVVSGEKISLRADDRQWLNAWDIVVRENSAALDMDIDDIYVGKKIPEYEIKEITQSNGSITGVKLDKGAQNGSGRTLYVAVFGADGNLKTVTFQSVDDVAMGTDISVTLNTALTAAEGDKVMAMIWNADLSPVCAAKE